MMLNYFVYCAKQGFALSPEDAHEILSQALKQERFTYRVNLGKDLVEIRVRGEEITMGRFSIPVSELEKVATFDDTTQVFFMSEEGLSRIAFYCYDRYYKLRNVGKGLAPTLEISGIRMHNIKGIDPWNDARRKIERLSLRRGEVVLDICTGLGYTASHAVLRGATVVTIEKDSAVLRVAEFNPWSRLLAHPSMIVIIGDAFDVLEELPERSFDAAVHDPPRFALAGELYSLEFYKRLRRVLKKGSKVFHYTGWPGKHRGLDIQAGVIRRLRAAGFEVIEVEKGYGIVARAV